MKAHGLARIGRDVEVRNVGGESVINLSLAFSYGRKGADGNRPTQWVDAAMWGKRAEALAPYLTKGSLICVDLEDVHTETYTSARGEGTKVVARVTNVDLAGGGQASPAPAQRAAPAQRQAPAAQGSGFDDMDSDIPF